MVVYILFSETRSRYYIGQTIDIDDRMKRHNEGRVLSTKNGRPWELKRQIPVSNRSEALKLERKVKKRGAKRFLEDRKKKGL
jgi:putative endonuclease